MGRRAGEAPSGTLPPRIVEHAPGHDDAEIGLVLHGLGHLITKRRRQALQVFGVEAIAIMAIFPTLPSRRPSTRIPEQLRQFTQLLLYLYRFGGIALSWVWAVSWLYMNERWGRRGPWLSESHSGVLRALLKAPESAVALRRNLVDPAKAGVDSHAARTLRRRSPRDPPSSSSCRTGRAGMRSAVRLQILAGASRGIRTRKAIETIVAEAGRLFDGLKPEQRDQLVKLLIDDPTESSILCLSGRRDKLRTWDRFRFLLAAIRRPFLRWHWAVRLTTTATAFLGALLVVDGVRTSRNPGWPQIKELRRLSEY